MSADNTSISSGLDAIFNIGPKESSTVAAIDMLQPSQVQPRQQFPQESLQELQASIRENGILQPILVRKNSNGFEIIAGERRWRAAQAIGLHEVPIICKDVDDNTALAFALIENIQRENLNVVDEAKALVRLLNELSVSHEDLALRLGKSRPYISNLLRLLSLTTDVLDLLATDKLSMGHARALLPLIGEKQVEVAHLVINRGLSVRATEKFVRDILSGKFDDDGTSPNTILNPQLSQWENELRNRLGSKVTIKNQPNGKAKLVVSLNNQEELAALVQRLYDYL